MPDPYEQPETTDAQAHTSTQSPRPERPIIAWLVAILLTAAAFAINNITPPASAPSKPTDPAQADTLPLRIASNQIMGIEAIYSGSGPFAGMSNSAMLGDPAEFAEQIELQAATPLEHLRAAMLASAIAPETALQILDRVNKSIADQIAPLDERATEIDPTAEELEEELDNIEATIEYLLALRAESDQLRSLWTNGHTALTDDQRAALTKRHNRYAEIALLHDNPDRETRIKPFHDRGIRLFAAFGGVLALVAIAAIVGLMLFIVAIVLTASGKLKWRLSESVGPAPTKTNALLEVFPIFMLCFLAVAILGGILAANIPGNFPINAIIIWPLLLCALWPTFRGISKSENRAALGWHTNGAGFPGFIKEMFLGVVGYCAGLPIVAFGLGCTFLALFIQSMINADAAPPSHPGVESMLNGDLISTLALYSLACLWAPIVEETIFRGAFFAHLRRGWHPILAALVTGFFFAIIHPQGLAATPGLMSLGVVFCLIREWRGSLVGSITAHALNNFVLISVLLIATA